MPTDYYHVKEKLNLSIIGATYTMFSGLKMQSIVNDISEEELMQFALIGAPWAAGAPGTIKIPFSAGGMLLPSDTEQKGLLNNCIQNIDRCVNTIGSDRHPVLCKVLDNYKKCIVAAQNGEDRWGLICELGLNKSVVFSADWQNPTDNIDDFEAMLKDLEYDKLYDHINERVDLELKLRDPNTSENELKMLNEKIINANTKIISVLKNQIKPENVAKYSSNYSSSAVKKKNGENNINEDENTIITTKKNYHESFFVNFDDTVAGQRGNPSIISALEEQNKLILNGTDIATNNLLQRTIDFKTYCEEVKTKLSLIISRNPKKYEALSPALNEFGTILRSCAFDIEKTNSFDPDSKNKIAESIRNLRTFASNKQINALLKEADAELKKEDDSTELKTYSESYLLERFANRSLANYRLDTLFLSELENSPAITIEGNFEKAKKDFIDFTIYSFFKYEYEIKSKPAVSKYLADHPDKTKSDAMKMINPPFARYVEKNFNIVANNKDFTNRIAHIENWKDLDREIKKATGDDGRGAWLMVIGALNITCNNIPNPTIDSNLIINSVSSNHNSNLNIINENSNLNIINENSNNNFFFGANKNTGRKSILEGLDDSNSINNINDIDSNLNIINENSNNNFFFEPKKKSLEELDDSNSINNPEDETFEINTSSSNNKPDDNIIITKDMSKKEYAENDTLNKLSQIFDLNIEKKVKDINPKLDRAERNSKLRMDSFYFDFKQFVNRTIHDNVQLSRVFIHHEDYDNIHTKLQNIKEKCDAASHPSRNDLSNGQLRNTASSKTAKKDTIENAFSILHDCIMVKEDIDNYLNRKNRQRFWWGKGHARVDHVKSLNRELENYIVRLIDNIQQSRIEKYNATNEKPMLDGNRLLMKNDLTAKCNFEKRIITGNRTYINSNTVLDIAMNHVFGKVNLTAEQYKSLNHWVKKDETLKRMADSFCLGRTYTFKNYYSKIKESDFVNELKKMNKEKLFEIFAYGTLRRVKAKEAEIRSKNDQRGLPEDAVTEAYAYMFLSSDILNVHRPHDCFRLVERIKNDADLYTVIRSMDQKYYTELLNNINNTEISSTEVLHNKLKKPAREAFKEYALIKVNKKLEEINNSDLPKWIKGNLEFAYNNLSEAAFDERNTIHDYAIERSLACLLACQIIPKDQIKEISADKFTDIVNDLTENPSFKNAALKYTSDDMVRRNIRLKSLLIDQDVCIKRLSEKLTRINNSISKTDIPKVRDNNVSKINNPIKSFA